MKKTCIKCGLEKDISEFYLNFMYKDNHSNICKKCSNLISKQWREEHKERKKELNKQYYERKKTEWMNNYGLNQNNN